jgi:hypothetical protein
LVNITSTFVNDLTIVSACGCCGCGVCIGTNGLLVPSAGGGGGGPMVAGSGTCSIVGNCTLNMASGNYSFVGGGSNNTSSGYYSFVGGGKFNEACGACSATLSGAYNLSCGCNSVISGGCRNTISSLYSSNTISGGYCNLSCGCDNNTIGGGRCNCIAINGNNVIGGGQCNNNSGDGSFIGGGCNNFTLGFVSVLVGGCYNSVCGNNAFVGGGQCNIALCDFTGVFGCDVTNTTACSFMSNQLVACNIFGAGDICADANGVIVPVSSDKRLKTNICSLACGIDRVSLLNPVTYTWIDEKYGKGGQIGFIAQEVEKVVPEAVFKTSDDTYGFNDRPLVALLTKTIQEQEVRITKLEKLVESLLEN